MRIKIKKFKTLENIEFSTGSEICGRNGVGKTSCLEAISWCLFGANLQGERMQINEVFNQLKKPKRDDYVSVSVEFNYHIFERFCELEFDKFDEVVKGSKTAYYIDGNVFPSAEFARQIGQNFGLCETFLQNLFWNLPQKNKVDLVAGILGTEIPKINMPVLRKKVAECEENLVRKTAILDNLSKENASKIIDIKPINEEISKLKSSLVDISETTEFIELSDEKKRILSEEFEPLKLISDEELRAKLLGKIERKKYVELTELKDIYKAVNKDYPEQPKEPVNNGLCTVCEFCKDTTCPNFRSDFETEKRKFDVEMQKWLSVCKEIDEFNLSEKNKEVESIKLHEISLKQRDLDVLKNKEIDEENEKIDAKNEKIEINNDEIYRQIQNLQSENLCRKNDYEVLKAEFDAAKSDKISTINAKIDDLNFIEVNSKLNDEISQLQKQRDLAIENNAKVDFVLSSIKNAEIEQNSAKKGLFDAQKELDNSKKIIDNFRRNFETVCMENLGFRVNLLKENFSGNIEQCFEIFARRGVEEINFENLNESDLVINLCEFLLRLREFSGIKNVPNLIDRCGEIDEVRIPDNSIVARRTDSPKLTIINNY